MHLQVKIYIENVYGHRLGDRGMRTHLRCATRMKNRPTKTPVILGWVYHTLRKISMIHMYVYIYTYMQSMYVD